MSRVLLRLAAVVAAMAAAGSAQAAFSVTLSVAGSPNQVFNLPNAGGNASGSIGGYQFQISAFGNSPGIGNTGLLTQTTISVTSAGGLPNLIVTTFSDGFTAGAPGGPASLLNSIGGSTLPSGTASATSTVSPGATTAVATITPGTPPAPASSTIGFNTTTPFSMSNQLTLAGVVGTASVTVTSTVTVTPQAVPAPPALLLAGLGVPALGLLRRWTRKGTEPVVA